MTEPTEEEIERAERIKRLREGEPVERRERRRPDPPDGSPTDPPDSADGSGDPDEGTDTASPESGDLEVPADAPEDLTTASLYLQEDFSERLLELESHLDHLISRNFDGDVDGPRHVRPLAMYLGVRQIEKLDAAEIVALFEGIDEIESP